MSKGCNPCRITSVLIVLGVVTVFLRLVHAVTWSWLYVTMPFQFTFAIIGTMVLINWRKLRAPVAEASASGRCAT
jgi:hypothetical protein